MKSHNKSHILYNLILYSLTSLVTIFFFSYQFLFLSVKSLWFALPSINVSNFVPLDARCIFILVNIIIVFILVKETKVARLSALDPSSDIYDVYIERSRESIARRPKVMNPTFVVEEKKIEEKRHGNVKEMRVCNSLNHNKEKKKGMRACKSEVWNHKNEIVQSENITNGKKEGEIEDLNQRVEAFIARINNQRLLDAKLVDRGRG